jgi:hypothetical protein
MRETLYTDFDGESLFLVGLFTSFACFRFVDSVVGIEPLGGSTSEVLCLTYLLNVCGDGGDVKEGSEWDHPNSSSFPIVHLDEIRSPSSP